MPLLFCQNEWKINIENAGNSDKNHRSHKLNIVEMKMRSLGFPIMGASLTAIKLLLDLNPVNCDSIGKDKIRLRTLHRILETNY